MIFNSMIKTFNYKFLKIILGEKGDVVKIRGPKQDVEKCHRHLMKLVKELRESSFVLEVPIFKQFHKYIIGKGGANIRKVQLLKPNMLII